VREESTSPCNTKGDVLPAVRSSFQKLYNDADYNLN